MKNTLITHIATFSALVSISSGQIIMEDFDTINSDYTTTGTVTTTATGNSGNGMEAAAGTNYLIFDQALTSSADFSGTFDFYIVESGNYSNGAFWIGDPAGSTAGDAIRVDLREKTFGARANILDGDGTTLFDGSGNNNYEISTNTWYSASFSWTASTGDFSFSWGGTEGPMTVSSYSFNSSSVQIAFGTKDDPARFDNISITGTAIPEASAAFLVGLASLALLRRRR